MSTFKIAVETIDTVSPHPNADRLDIATLVGMSFEFIILKGQFKPGDRVVYYPVDSLLPAEVTDKLGLTGKLCGKNKNRVKTIKLRGCISQGIVGSTDILGGLDHTDPREDYASVLGILKYEPEEHHPGGPNRPRGERGGPTLADGVSVYDIEGCDRYKAIVQSLMPIEMLVMEKVEGRHAALTRFPDGRIVRMSRRHSLPDAPEDLAACDWHWGMTNSGWYTAIEKLAKRFPEDQVTIRGELVGPGCQGNIYGLKQNMVVAFDIEVGSLPLCGSTFLAMCNHIGIETVPVLAFNVTLEAWLDGKDAKTASTGKSLIKPDILREGIVFRPYNKLQAEQTIRGLGRPILKYRSPEYLAGSEL